MSRARSPKSKPARRPAAPERTHVASRLGAESNAAALAFAVLSLTSIGAVAVFSATAPLALEEALPPYFLRHAVALLVGSVLALIAARIPLSIWHRLALPLWTLSVLGVGATLVIGLVGGGATRTPASRASASSV